MEPFIGEIRMFAGNFAPLNWLFCNGQSMSIQDNQELFALIGTTYGGDGQNTFNLPNLSGRLPIGYGAAVGGTYVLGQSSGSETVTLTGAQMPIHSHGLQAASDNGSSSAPSGALLASGATIYQGFAPITAFNGNAVIPSSGGAPHDNVMPFLAVNFIISLYGNYPTQS